MIMSIIYYSLQLSIRLNSNFQDNFLQFLHAIFYNIFNQAQIATNIFGILENEACP